MKPNHRKLIPISILMIFVLLACGPFGSVTIPTPDLQQLQTGAAQTIAALAGGPTEANTQPPAQVPSNTAEVATQPLLPTSSPTQAGTCDKVTFISETIPDGTVFAPSTAFTKTWRVQNTGTCTWTSSYAIVFDHGDALGAPATVPFPGSVVPGQEVDLAINMTAPVTPGNYASYWKFRNATGILFVTNPFSVVITVPGPTATPTFGIIVPPIITIIPLLPSTNQVVNQVTVNAGTVNSATANCASGDKVSGGGFALNTGLIAYTHSMQGNGWQAYAENTTGSNLLLNSYAICMHNVSGTVSQVYSQVTAAAGGIGHATVACPGGSVVTGGGYASNDKFFVYNSSMNGNGWEVYAKNNASGSGLLNAYAVCLSGSGGSTSQILAQKSIAGGAVDSVEATCPSGTLLTGGGFAGSTNIWVYNISMKGGSPKTWNVYGSNLTGSSQLLNSYAICLTLP